MIGWLKRVMAQETGQALEGAVVPADKAKEQADQWIRTGFQHYQEQRLKEAENCFRRVLEIDPSNVDALYLVGDIARATDRFAEAAELIWKAIDIKDDVSAFHFGLGATLQELGDFYGAQTHYRRAVELDPVDAAATVNLGYAYECQGDIDTALAYYSKAAKMGPNLSIARLNMARLLLLRGKFEEGWETYEVRWSMDFLAPQAQAFPKPRWNGDTVRDKTILMHVEQGHGDTFQFVRYAPLVAQRCDKVVLACLPEQKALLESVDGIHRVIAGTDPVPPYDLKLPLMSAPLVFKTNLSNIPVEIPYLSAPQHSRNKFRSLLPDGEHHVKVGLVWATSAGNRDNYARRSCELSMFAPLARVPDATFYSLQVGKEASQASFPPNGMRLADFTMHLDDFADTAALIERLDLVISVDTAVAHLAGALGKPVWTLVPYVAGWRWLLEREDSPWYPTMRLFRQPRPGRWDGVFERIATELEHFVAASK